MTTGEAAHEGSPILSIMGIMAAQRDGFTLTQYQWAIRAAWKVLAQQ